MNYVSSAIVTIFLEKSVFTWNQLIPNVKSSKDCTPNHFWKVSSFMTHFTKSQTLTTNVRLFFLKNFNLIMPPLQGLYIV